ncbi:hypothetical protein HJ590_03685 [Naumannella sp. ID2617S]|nr:hypothetical protein [Naumannella sp. ID2617S]
MSTNDPQDPFDRNRTSGTGAFQNPNTTTGAHGTDDRSRTDVAKEQASGVKDHAAEAGKDLTQTARAEAGSVVRDARSEVRSLVDTSVHELRGQASRGQQQVAEQVRTIAKEFGEMASGNENSGTASKLARQASEQGTQLASWLEHHEPADVLDQARRFAARRPLAFLAIAAGAGLLVGRFARGMQAEHADDNTAQQGQGSRSQYYYQDPGYSQVPAGTGFETQSPSAYGTGAHGGPAYQQPGHAGSGYEQVQGHNDGLTPPAQEQGFVPGQGFSGGRPLGDQGGSAQSGGWSGESR